MLATVAIRLRWTLLARKAAGQFLGTGLSLLRVASRRPCAHHHSLPIKAQHLIGLAWRAADLAEQGWV